ncbi:hypothetical protein [Desulfopila aestuarii]|uniref:Uncharacterized protein n=1 Tax=Desulfopila aestuarii DSM 18488 TaxID=1121416 RepID=A0A1M7YLK2_9BACT|nr:hypothetical protein [Desulfopila aestuarii]SHO53505.1 hypothetical protein SAMN02745220_05171 [Desulfopila aestuarii DSM 18488]
MKTVACKDTIFKLLEQDGPFATRDTIHYQPLFSPFSRNQVVSLKKSHLLNRYFITRNQIFEFLDVRSYVEIKNLIDNEDCRKVTRHRAYSLLSRMFGIAGNESECLTAIKNYSRTADGVIRYLKRAVLSPYSSYLDMDNKVDAIYDPVELLLIPFDDRYHKKARFEAKRKLILMQLAAAIEQRERETEIETKFADFLDFLNNYVWSADAKIGEQEPAFLVSRHSPEDFSCCDVAVHTWDRVLEDTEKSFEPGLKRTLIKRLWFHSGNRKIPIYVIVRKKEPVAKVLKLLRKGEENPDIAVADELGLMGVLDRIADVRIFQKHLVESAFRAGSFLIQEDVSDTLEGRFHHNGNAGSSANTPMLKFFARMGGMRVEFIIHTNKSFLNYIYQRGVAHREYEVNRLFDSGVADLLFPKDIYFLDLASIKSNLLHRFRQQIENEQ